MDLIRLSPHLFREDLRRLTKVRTALGESAPAGVRQRGATCS